MLIPIGHEGGNLRRRPWVTFGVMGICLLVLILTQTFSGVSRIDRLALSALEYYFEHPYLELDEEFADLAAPLLHQREALMEGLAGAAPRPKRGDIEKEQAKLDRLVRKTLDALEQNAYMRFGLIPNKFNPLDLFTSMFMHGGWFHLIGNLLIFYLAGPYLEDVWGRRLFAVFYLGGGIAAGMTEVVAHSASDVPIVGASGAIAAVMGAFLVRYFTTRILFFYWIGFFFKGTFYAPAWLMLPLWFGEQLFFAMLNEGSGGGGGGGVAYLAHIGGFVFGAVVAYGIRAAQLEEKVLAPALQNEVESTLIDNTAVEEALELRDRGDAAAALAALTAELQARPNNHDAALAAWEVAGPLGRAAEVAPAMGRYVLHLLRTNETEQATAQWREVVQAVPDARVEAPVCLRLAQSFARRNLPGEVVPLLRRALHVAGRDLPPALAVQIAQCGVQHDPESADYAIRLTLARPDVDPDVRQQLEALQRQLPGRSARG